MTESTTLRGVLTQLVCDPWNSLGRRWNYKSAVLSALVRSTLFFATNASAGLDAAASAALTEAALRLTTAGFYGALTQSFRRVEPTRAGTLAAMVLLPTVAHGLELLVHSAMGTPALARSIVTSVGLTAVSTAFHLFAMRHGVLIVGQDRRTMLQDLAAIPRLLALFIVDNARFVVRACL